MQVLGYTYLADYHCPDCARKAFGASLDTDAPTDYEGNLVLPVYSWELEEDTYCGDCGANIYEAFRWERYDPVSISVTDILEDPEA